jgi:hypothetical protein
MFQAVTELRGTTALARQHQPLDRPPASPCKQCATATVVPLTSKAFGYRHSMDA